AVEHHQLLGDLAHRTAHPGPLAFEVGAAHAVEGGRLATGVLAHEAHLLGGHVDLAVTKLEPEVVALDATHGERLHLQVAPHALYEVHHVVARFEIVVVVGAAARTAGAAVDAAPAGEVGLGDQRQPGGGEDRTPLERRGDDADRARGRLAGIH